MMRITRRSVLGAGLLLPFVGQAAAPVLRPNILFVLADDWGWPSSEARDWLGMRLPAFDRVRAAGMSFTNAFAAAPSCTASRGSILTGLWPWQLAEGANLASTLPARLPVYPDALEKAGYHVGFVGKGWAPGKIASGGRTRNPAGNAYPGIEEFLGRREAGRPVCLWVGSTDPHRPYQKGLRASDEPTVPPGRLPPTLPDVDMVRRDASDYVAATERFDRELGAALAAFERAGLLENTLVVVTGDNGWAFPRGKASLYDAGTHVPLAIQWPGMVRAGTTTTAPVSLADLAPTFLEAAGLPVPKGLSGQSLVPLLRGAPSRRRFVLTGMERHMDGRTVAGQGYPMRAIRTERHLYIRNFAPDRWPAGDPPRKPTDFDALATRIFAGFADIDAGRTKAWMVMNRDDPAVRPLYALATAKRPAVELYDVQADPHQLTNLAARPEHRALAARMDRELTAALRASGDPRVLGQGDVFDRYPPQSDPGYGRPTDF